MSPKRRIAVEARSYGRGAVQTDGNERATSLHESKADAIARAPEVAKERRTELVIKNKNGTIAERDRYGRASLPPRDKAR